MDYRDFLTGAFGRMALPRPANSNDRQGCGRKYHYTGLEIFSLCEAAKPYMEAGLIGHPILEGNTMRFPEPKGPKALLFIGKRENAFGGHDFVIDNNRGRIEPCTSLGVAICALRIQFESDLQNRRSGPSATP